MMVSVTYNGEVEDVTVQPATRASQLVENCRALWGIRIPAADLALSTTGGILLSDGDFVTPRAGTSPVHSAYPLRPRVL